MMEIKSIPQTIVDEALAIGATNIVLYFSGGNDEGYLDVVLYTSDKALEPSDASKALVKVIEQWVDDAYPYNGAGDGVDFGDTIEYDLSKGLVTHEEWFYKRVENKAEQKLEIE